MTAAEEAIARWKADSIALNQGASPATLAELAAFLGAELPADVRDFYRAADGMADDVDGLVGFWSIKKIIGEPEIRTGADERGTYRDVAFADVMISSWFFYFRVRGALVTVFSENTAEELPSMSDLVRRYLADPDSLLI